MFLYLSPMIEKLQSSEIDLSCLVSGRNHGKYSFNDHRHLSRPNIPHDYNNNEYSDFGDNHVNILWYNKYAIEDEKRHRESNEPVLLSLLIRFRRHYYNDHNHRIDSQCCRHLSERLWDWLFATGDHCHGVGRHRHDTSPCGWDDHSICKNDYTFTERQLKSSPSLSRSIADTTGDSGRERNIGLEKKDTTYLYCSCAAVWWVNVCVCVYEWVGENWLSIYFVWSKPSSLIAAYWEGISIRAWRANDESELFEACTMLLKLTNWKLSNCRVGNESSNSFIISHGPSPTPIITIERG